MIFAGPCGGCTIDAFKNSLEFWNNRMGFFMDWTLTAGNLMIGQRGPTR